MRLPDYRLSKRVCVCVCLIFLGRRPFGTLGWARGRPDLGLDSLGQGSGSGHDGCFHGGLEH